MKFLVAALALVFLPISSFAKASSDCDYSFDIENSVVEGTGYKYTKKTGVTGRFSGIKINEKKTAKKPQELLKGLVVTVNLMTLDSGNSLRDKNMRETLFTGVLGDSVATVSVKKVMENKLSAELKINEKTQMIDFDYSIDEDKQTVSAQGVFDAVKFAMGDQIAALKKRCGSLHTGADGKSVTWTDFSLSVKAKLNKSCGKKS